MNITTEQLANRQIAVMVQPDDERVQKALQNAARKISQRYVVPGYRKGKAPYAAIVRMVGKDALYEQVAEDMADEVYRQALDQDDLDPIAPGVLESVTFEPFVYRFVLPLSPEVNLGDYRAVRAERTPVEVSDDEVAVELQKLQQEQTEWLPLDESAGAAYGDLLTLAIVGMVGDEELINDEAFELVLEENMEDFPPGFDAQMLDVTAGSKLAFDITYPEDWPSERAGAVAHFDADVLSIKREDKPELDDAFALLIGDFGNLDGLKAHVREQLVKGRQENADEAYLDQVAEEMLKVAHIDYPPALVNVAVDRLYESEERRIRGFGIEMSDYLRIMKKTEDALRNEMRPAAEKRLQFDLLLGELIAVEKLEAGKDEVDNYISKALADLTGQNEEVREFLESELGHNAIASEIIQRKALERIIAIGAGEAPDLPAEEPAAEVAVEAEA